MTKDELYDYALNALAVPVGAADEAAFGLPSKYSSTLKQGLEQYPKAAMAGRVGSYFIPGTGVVGGLGKVGKMLGLLKEGKLAAREAKPAIELLMKIAKGAGIGAAESGGQVAIRKSLGTSGGEADISDAASTGAKIGGAIGMVSPALGAAAKKIYFDPRIVNSKYPNSIAAGEELLKRGVIGGENTFKKYAGAAGDEYNRILGKYQHGVASDTAPIENVLEKFANRAEAKRDAGNLTSLRQFKATGEGATGRLGEAPTGKDIFDYRKIMNEELSSLAPQKRSLAIGGAGGEAGKISAKDEAFGAMKASLDDAERAMISKRFGQEGSAAIDAAKKEYGVRRELGRALEKGKDPGLVLPSLVGAAGMGGAAMSGNPSNMIIGAGLGLGTAAARTLPARTTIGVMLDRLGSSSGKTPARLKEMLGRQSEEKNPYEKFTTVDESNPYERYAK